MEVKAVKTLTQKPEKNMQAVPNEVVPAAAASSFALSIACGR
jgi:hypothetical protein